MEAAALPAAFAEVEFQAGAFRVACLQYRVRV
jgi:hypothetical protein